MLFRADAGPEIGAGHVMRCLAVAEALHDWARERGQVLASHFLCAPLPPLLKARLDSAGCIVHDLPVAAGSADDANHTLHLVRSLPAQTMVLDGYHFGTEYCAILAAGRRLSPRVPLVLFDDLAAFECPNAPLDVDVVVNPSPAAFALPYRRIAPIARLLLGPTYAPLRREFRLITQEQAPLPVIARDTVLVTFGGTEPQGLTGPCLTQLAAMLPKTCRLAATIGAGDPRADALEKRVAEKRVALVKPGRITLHRDTSAMATLINSAGMAVAAAGGTIFELSALGVPAVLVVVSDNQMHSAAWMAAEGLATVIDGRAAEAVEMIATAAETLWADSTRRQTMAETLAGRIDGLGAVRIAEALMAIAK
ncbi:MAG: UDP-2,4-diacetamido-2,4,6-trideoxy-beta-L-altropyranose hydrolase [Nitrospirae bacterium]|nr:UDP-2,4-diacetamido-2,4,6-trideoxy-beta-L-altropyranose hydrolase [Nitrospirota bacterium]